ncbi:hypothetical protein SCHPADRAFT_675847 [Schizopora paradoxa]|uniref:Uncharacterized protein n=1 Tax=Schizopora paradoxa TaxID=27342 RepID=A0A0H2R4Y3_9AGAM|nr:hypothetical protein SCHPADRAFT_675847 [Schizopora paradoxa]
MQHRRMPLRGDSFREVIENELPPVFQPLHFGLQVGEDAYGLVPSRTAPVQRLSTYKLYLAMVEPQKKLRFFKRTTTFLLSVCECYATYILNTKGADENTPCKGSFALFP